MKLKGNGWSLKGHGWSLKGHGWSLKGHGWICDITMDKKGHGWRIQRKWKLKREINNLLDVLVGYMDVWRTSWVMMDAWCCGLEHVVIMDEVWKVMNGYVMWWWLRKVDKGFMESES